MYKQNEKKKTVLWQLAKLADCQLLTASLSLRGYFKLTSDLHLKMDDA
jgi:hypothetical protein